MVLWATASLQENARRGDDLQRFEIAGPVGRVEDHLGGGAVG